MFKYICFSIKKTVHFSRSRMSVTIKLKKHTIYIFKFVSGFIRNK